MRAAIPIWIAFVPSSIAWGLAAQDYGLSLREAVLMSAWVYSGPAQFAILGPLAEGGSPMQVLAAGLLMNLRFLPMSMALAPFFSGAKLVHRLASSQVISASSFIVPYMQFQKERSAAPSRSVSRITGSANLGFFLGVGSSSFIVWVLGTTGGFLAAFGFPSGYEEPLKFILPGYFAGLLVSEIKSWVAGAVCLASLLAAIVGALVNPAWGWLASAIVMATFGWGLEQWSLRAWRSSSSPA